MLGYAAKPRASDLLIRNTLKNMPLPAINIIHYNLALKRIIANLGENDGPNKPIDATSTDDTETDNAVEVIWQRLVHTLAVRRWNEGRNDEVDVAEQEEDGDGEGGVDRGVPVPL